MIQRYDIAEAPWGLAIDPEDDGEWVKWEDVKDMICISCEVMLRHERVKHALDLSYGIYDKREQEDNS